VLFVGTALGTAAWMRWPAMDTANELSLPTPVDEVATRKDRHGDPLPAHALARLGTVRFRHDWTLYASAVSPDGRLVAGGGNESVQVWDAQTGRALQRLSGFHNGVSALAFSPDSKVLAGYGHSRKLRLIDMATGQSLKDVDLEDVAVSNSYTPSHVYFLSPRRLLLLHDGGEPLVRLFDVPTAKTIRRFPSEGRHLYDVAVSPDGQLLAVAEETGTVRVWDVKSGKEHRVLKKHKGTDGSLAFAPDGKTLATGGLEGDACLWDLASGALKHTLAARIAEFTWTDSDGKKHVQRNLPLGGVRSVSFSPKGDRLVTSHGYWHVLWDPATGKEVRRISRATTGAARFLPDGKTLLVGGTERSHENTLHFLDATTGEPLQRFDGHDSRVEAVAYSSDGKYVATAEEGGSASVRVWEVASRRVIFEQGHPHRGRASALAFKPQGDVLASGHGREVLFWDFKTGKLLRTFPGHKHIHMALAFSPDGRRLASGSYDGTVRVWDVEGGKELQNFRVEKEIAWAIAFSPDLRWAASGDQATRTIHLWDLDTGKEWKPLPRGGGGGIRLAFSPDSRTLLEAGGIASLFLWDVASGERRATIRTTNPAWSLAFAPDGRRLAVGVLVASRRMAKAEPSRGPVELFDLPTQTSLATLQGHDGSVYGVAFSPDGRTLVSASADTTALLWDVSSSHASRAALTAEQRAACWDDLAESADQAYPSLWKLADDTGTVELIRSALRPAPTLPAPGELTRWFGDLASEQPAVRSSALDRLGKLGHGVEGELRKALAANPAGELRRNLEILLRQIERYRLRRLRAVEVLEHMNTPAARALLEDLVRDQPTTEHGREAKETLGRLARKPVRAS
jgi:WD40 repeat protein